ncbi:propanediol utilization protein PduA [Clostridium homopropionicum DSM 5847]|uniref:Propanediol utilization protein PduA n=1 Tax=Clostridium homopropionicum DSM 5847 TaxID=1121318 RepID=A0A0L6Z6K0_9CLOT|nr:BMC domain-containing protein [Clostridium homopropionicum]KOA18592.1 propanediol utilization protein PduA [Clostridium homopropionicum DSM 5847]SFG49289.1 Carboxysome shell and ethanolamine utilization microcompartment protein CcmL/EutN [Clostridium homopropionicum]
MNNYDAIGIVEAKHFTTALELLDNMCKASGVTFLSSEKKLGGRLVTIIVGGSIGDVKTAVEAAKLSCQGREQLLKGAIVISKPHEEIMKFIIGNHEENEKLENEKEVAQQEVIKEEVVQAEEKPKKNRTRRNVNEN